MQGCRERKTARLGRMTLGTGMPAICVPVMGGSMDEIRQSAMRAREAQADIIELRIDHFCVSPDLRDAIEACHAVREAAEDIPLLFTMRTKRDGGKGSADAAVYEELLSGVIESGCCDGIDCELSVGKDAFVRIAKKAREKGMTLVGSSHEFGEIGCMRKAAEWLMAQQALGADVCKAAVMTKTNAEALELAWVFAQAYEQLEIPMIGIAMGPAGVVTRIGGACMGSCLTFGTAGAASAPGQIDARRLRTALEIVQDAIQ